MNKEEILEKLRKMLRKLCYKDGVDYDSISLSDELVANLGLDSIQIIMMAIGIEKEFDVVISNIDFSSFTSVGDVVSYIEVKINENI